MTVPKKPRILVVDDERFYIDLLVDLLKEDYTVLVAREGLEALRRAGTQDPPDLILLDILMPGIDGYEVCRRLKSDPATRDIPVIFLTVKTDTEDEIHGFDLGAVDYITKPMSPPIVKTRVKTHLEMKYRREKILGENILLGKEVADRVREIQRIQDIAIFCLASLAETRDPDTGLHIRRTQRYVKRLARQIRTREPYAEELDDSRIELLFKTAPLHDIGKVGLPDRILLKPARLTPEEFEEMKLHTVYGFEAIQRAEAVFGQTEFLRLAEEIAISHHERWDGTGYPYGLSGSDIPLPGRLLALADVYDALISDRVYKPALSHEEALQTIKESSGSHFDPTLAEAFLEIEADVRQIAEELKEPEPVST